MSPILGTNEKTGTNGKCRKPLIHKALMEFVPEFVPAREKPIGYLIFLSPTLFFSSGDKFGDKMKETPKVWAFLAFSICPHILRTGTNDQKSPILRAFSKGSFCPRFSCFGDKRGQNSHFYLSPPPILLSPYFPQRQMPGTNLSPDFKGLFVSDFLSPGTKRDLTVYFLHIG